MKRKEIDQNRRMTLLLEQCKYLLTTPQLTKVNSSAAPKSCTSPRRVEDQPELPVKVHFPKHAQFCSANLPDIYQALQEGKATESMRSIRTIPY